MSDTPSNHGILGLVILLLLLGRQKSGSPYEESGIFTGSGLGNLSALGKNLRLDHFARDMHRVVAMMDQVEGLTQMTGLTQLASASAPQSRITGAVNSVSDAFSGQDLSQLMEMAGPLMAMLGNSEKK